MKKLLNISVIAALAVLPVAANAARTVTTGGSAGAGSTSALATQSYVNGAYNAMNNKVDAVITDSEVAAKQEGNYAAIHAGDSVSENLVALDEAVAGLTSGNGSVTNQIKTQAAGADYTNASMNGISTISGAIANLDTRTDALETTMGDTSLSGVTGLTANTATGAIVELQNDKQEKSNSEVTNAGNYLTTGYGVGANLEALDTAVGKVGTGTHNTGIAAGNSVAANIEALDTAIGNLGSASTNTYQTKSDSTASAGTYVQAGTGVGANLNALDSQVATNTAAIATINSKQIPIVSDWANQGTVTYTTIASLTGAQAAPVVDCTDPANAENPACL